MFQNTKGTKPQAGLDIEPSDDEDVISNIIIRNCVSRNNAGSGYLIYLRKLTNQSHDVSIFIDNCLSINNGERVFRSGSTTEGEPKTVIKFNNFIVVK